ncbi:MAG: hypothetical protein QGI09_11965, partial [Dehalococcoidia bacterium]|nr:hypothetical protein [Dehalococcoidia bacterium]
MVQEYLRRVADLTLRTKDLVCSVRSSAASVLLTCDWDTSAPFLGYSTLNPGAHTTSKTLGFSTSPICPIFADDLHPTHLIVTFDPPPPTFRHKLYPDYKANRPPVPEGLLEDCERVRERLESLDVVFCTVQGYEADDVLGTLSTRASVSGFQTMIMTSDLDLLQLVSP